MFARNDGDAEANCHLFASVGMYRLARGRGTRIPLALAESPVPASRGAGGPHLEVVARIVAAPADPTRARLIREAPLHESVWIRMTLQP